MATYQMLKTQPGVVTGEIHPRVFHEGKTYEIDDELASQFKELDIIKPSKDDVSVAENEEGRTDLHENWLDTDPAVLRHGELTAKEVVAKDESPASNAPAEQVPGKAEGEEKADGESEGKKAKKAAPENK